MKKILCLALSLCLLITSCGLITLPSQAEEPETGVNLIGYYNKTTGTVKTSDYDTSTAKDLNLTAERGGFTYSYVPMTPPLAAVDKATDSTVAEGTWMISASKLTQTLKDFENPQSAAYGSWLSCADNKQYFYADNSAVVPSYLDGTLLFPPGRFFVRAVAGLQNGHTYQISVDHYGYGGASELYLGFSKTAHSVEVPTGSGKIAVARAAWNTATFTVENTATADNGMTYLQLYTGGANSVRIMNLSVVDLSKGITVTSNHAKWGAASADKSVVTEEEEEVTLTATPYGDAAFEGWYDGDSLVSKANPYTFTATGSVNYIAKFSSSNIIGTGETNYDSPTFEEFPVNTNLRIEPKTYDADAALSGDTPAANIPNTLNAFKNTAETYGQWLPQYINGQDLTYAYAEWNDSVLKVAANPVAASAVNTSAKCLQLGYHSRQYVRRVDGLTPGKTYKFSFKYYVGGANIGETVFEAAILDEAAAFEKYMPVTSIVKFNANSDWAIGEFIYQHPVNSESSSAFIKLNARASGTAARTYYIDDLSLTDKSITVTSNHAKWGAASADKSVVTEEEEEVTLTATPYGDAAFEGWYDGDSLVSKANPYTFTATGSINYIAKFSSSNIIGTGETNYDSPTFEEFPVNTNLRIEPKTYDADAALSGDTPAANIPNTLNAFKNTAETYGQWLPQYINGQDLTYAYAEWNDSVLKVAANPVAASAVNTSAKCLQLGYHSRQYVRRVDGLTPGKTYKFSFKYYVGGANTGETVFDAAILDEAAAFEKYMPVTSIVKFNANSDWAIGEFIYQHPVNSESSSAFIKLNARASGTATRTYYIDDLSLTEMGNTSVVDEVVGFSGNAMRTTGNQALRFKFYVPDEFKTKIYNKEVSELGFLVQYKEILGGNELVLGGKYNYGGKEFGVNTGIGYNNNGTDIVFEERDGKTYYSAALLNIGAKGDGTVNYNYYSQALCVRPYIKLVDGTVLYGSVQESTVFDTMAYILNEANAEVLEADRVAVQALLEANTDLYNAYEGWRK